ncbi:hypothetical protein MMC13_000116 [Lambiella insularis]|nr:hypothetical protein [Lambiella insularis]
MAQADAITVAAVLLLHSRLQDDEDIANVLNSNLPLVGHGYRARDHRFTGGDAKEIWHHILSGRVSTIDLLKDINRGWSGDNDETAYSC